MSGASLDGRLLNVVVTGACGRMGRALVQAVSQAEGLRLYGATTLPGDALVGADAGSVAGMGAAGVAIVDALDEVIAGADVVIDFTAPDATLEHARVCAERNVALIVGTTGFSPDERARMQDYAARTPIVMAPNMSIGVNVLFRIANEVAKTLGDAWDVEVVETHHRLKKDAPSGTALGLCETLADALGLDVATDLITERKGFTGERPHGKIGMQTLRGGDVVGDHTVFFFGEGERLELTHRASSRANFAQGAVRAARFAAGRPPALYDMMDVLGLRAGGAT